MIYFDEIFQEDFFVKDMARILKNNMYLRFKLRENESFKKKDAYAMIFINPGYIDQNIN